MTRASTRPLQAAVELLRHIGAGKLDNEIATARTDEFGELLAGLATTQQQLRDRTDADQRRTAEDHPAAREADRQALEADRKRSEADRRALEEIQEMVSAVVAGQVGRRLFHRRQGRASLVSWRRASIRLIESVARVW